MTKIDKDKIAWVYEAESDDFELTYDEEQIMKAMRKVNSLWKAYKKKPKGNNLILFCGSGCSMRYGTPIYDNVIESFEHITCDGGDGGDNF